MHSTGCYRLCKICGHGGAYSADKWPTHDVKCALHGLPSPPNVLNARRKVWQMWQVLPRINAALRIKNDDAPEVRVWDALIAAGIINSCFDQPAHCAEALRAGGYETRAKLKKARADDYDLGLLRSAFAEIKRKGR